ncbi:MAG TPA: exodeoxyribonuclease III [Acidimicrobiales bacterium]|nr:exodeoxyribonuclease III [Acidimicrobiales bacterium]
MRIVTWNVNSLPARLPYVLEWAEANGPDVLCLQETKLADDAFPEEALAELGYQVAHYGDGRWNGVAVASRVGLVDPVPGFGSALDEQGCRIVAATCDGVRVHSVYVPNGRSLDSDQYPLKLTWLAGLRSYLAERAKPSEDLVVCGDFNVAPDDRDVWDPAAFQHSTHTSPQERQALEAIVDWGLVDVFRRHHDEGGIFSWWDYRAGDFHQGRGMRIDLALLTKGLADRSTAVAVDRNARKKSAAGNKPSDHAPVVVDVVG